MKIDVVASVRQDVTIQVTIEEVIESINEIDMVLRWNYLGKLLNGIDLKSEKITPSQHAMVKAFLERKIEQLK